MITLYRSPSNQIHYTHAPLRLSTASFGPDGNYQPICCLYEKVLWEGLLLSAHSTDDQNWIRKKMSDAISKLFWFNQMTSPQGIQLTFRKPAGGCLTAGEIMKASHWLNPFFIMSQLFVCQNLPFSHGSERCSQASVVPLILYAIALQFLHGATWPVWAVNSCTTTGLGSVSLRTGQKLWQLFSVKITNLPPPTAHSVPCHVFTKRWLNTTATVRPGPLIPVTLDRGVHNKSITHSLKMKIKRASD